MKPFNKENKGHLGRSPLFLGEELGVLDTINVTYPKLETLYQEQLSQLWNEFEIDLTQDRMDMINLPKETTDLMVKTLMWQTVADSVATRTIGEVLNKYVSNSELSCLIKVWEFFEIIHSRTYSHIIKQTFVQPNDMLDQMYKDTEVLARSQQIFDVLEEVSNLSGDATESDKRKAIIKALTCFFALESIAFMASFAVTFAIVKQGVFSGIGQDVKLICRDEVLHQKIAHTVLTELKSEWPEEFAEVVPECGSILHSVMDNEIGWAKSLFKGHSLVGLNADILESYVKFLSKPAFNLFNLAPPEGGKDLAYMEEYVSGKGVQAAPQEIQITAYRVGSVLDDTSGLTF